MLRPMDKDNSELFQTIQCSKTSAKQVPSEDRKYLNTGRMTKLIRTIITDTGADEWMQIIPPLQEKAAHGQNPWLRSMNLLNTKASTYIIKKRSARLNILGLKNACRVQMLRRTLNCNASDRSNNTANTKKQRAFQKVDSANHNESQCETLPVLVDTTIRALYGPLLSLW